MLGKIFRVSERASESGKEFEYFYFYFLNCSNFGKKKTLSEQNLNTREATK